MKKRKTYEVSIIDKTYSKIISDETKFYTSDTALELVFKLKETEYIFESAEIVLLNIDDRSLVTRTVTKVSNDFVYEIDDDITAHYGEWRGQLRFEQAGEVYVSSPVKFRIENDLGNERPPQLSDVQSWVSLKRYADSLTEELKQAVLSVEGVEDTFNANETERQNTFETAEQSRQITFETNESERDETFNDNETTRQTQELEREKAETARQTTFDSNEASRAETFNANEATRQENETTRQQGENQRQTTFQTNESERQGTFETAEQERQSAEVIRVENENQRKSDHANRSAELDGKADKVIIKNLVENGDFSDGLTGWLNYQDRLNIEFIEDFVRLEGVINASRLEYALEVNSNDKVYYSVSTRSVNVIDSSMGIGGSLVIDKPFTHSENWVNESGIYNIAHGNLSIIVRAIGNILDVRHVMAINLTEIFGAGNEPTKEEMDRLIEITGYIDSEYALNNKEMLGYLMNDIREKANKKQEDWITPTLLNGWAQHSTYLPLRYMKDEFGFVHLQGHVVAGTSQDVMLLPEGYRPTGSLEVTVNTTYNRVETNLCWLTTGGRVFVRSSGAGTMVSFHITFKAG